MSRIHVLLIPLVAGAACVGTQKGAPEASDSAAPSTPDTAPPPTDSGTTPEPPPCEPVTRGTVWAQDQDGDCVPGLSDCDDLDPEVNGGEEVCDGKDNDCNGLVDDGVLLTWFLDVDGDGYASEEVETCSMPEPWLAGESLGTDCDDTDATIHPEVVGWEPVTGIEVPGDGVDQDCDGEDACGMVCVGTKCGFDTTAEAEAFCDTWGQAARLEVGVPGTDLSAVDCLCTPPQEVVIWVGDGSAQSLAGLETWFPTDTLRFYGLSTNETPFDFSGLEGVDEIPPAVVVQCSGTDPSRFDVHFTGLSRVERLGGLVFGDLGDGCDNTDTAVDLSGLDRVRTIDGDLDLYHNRFQSLHGLEALEEVGGSVSIDESANGPTDIHALSALRRVGGHVYIEPDVDLTPLAGLESVGGTLFLRGGTVPTFAALEHVGGLYFSSVPSSSMAQFGWVTALSDLGVSVAETSLSGLDQVSSVGGVLSLSYNSSLTSAQGLGAVTSVGTSLLVDGNDSLVDFTGLSALTTVGHYFRVSENPSLTSLSGLSALTTVGYHMEIVENDVLTGLDGLSALTDVAGNVWVEANPALDLGADLPLARVGGHFVLMDNPSVTTLDGLGSLRSVAGTLYIVNNDQLTSLQGLYGLSWVGGDVWFQGNARLTDEEIYAFLDHLGRENIGLRVIVE